jgi:hypothetical protein
LEFVTRVICAGEIPPSDMWRLLVNATYEQGNNYSGDIIIGMGPRLAELCLSAYGGHFLRVKNAMSDLKDEESQFEASLRLPGLTANIVDCLESDIGARPLLESMAKSGIAPIMTHTNKVVEMIAKLNIGGVVSKESKICGLSPTKWVGTTCSYALIPLSESARLVIARTLNAFTTIPASTIPTVDVDRTTIPAVDVDDLAVEVGETTRQARLTRRQPRRGVVLGAYKVCAGNLGLDQSIHFKFNHIQKSRLPFHHI